MHKYAIECIDFSIFTKTHIMPHMKTFVLFGSTGDLATRYVLPALGALLQK